MRLEKASYKAVKYSCMNYHYAKRVPAQPMTAFSVFNDENEFCGCVVFNIGIGNISKPYNLHNGEVCELVRVALNGKQSKTSKAVSIAVKLFKKINPLCKLLVSYADSDQNHNGTIYQAMNWYYVSSHKTGDKYIDPKTGKDVHSRSHSPKGYNIQFGNIKKVLNTNDLIRVKTGVKHKYILPLDKSLVSMCKQISKKYPNKCDDSVKDARLASSQEGEFDSTSSLNLTTWDAPKQISTGTR